MDNYEDLDPLYKKFVPICNSCKENCYRTYFRLEYSKLGICYFCGTNLDGNFNSIPLIDGRHIKIEFII